MPKTVLATECTYVMHPTNSFRWAVPQYTSTQPARLQQAWQATNGLVEWQDVPTVVVEETQDAR